MASYPESGGPFRLRTVSEKECTRWGGPLCRDSGRRIALRRPARSRDRAALRSNSPIQEALVRSNSQPSRALSSCLLTDDTARVRRSAKLEPLLPVGSLDVKSQGEH